MTRKNRPDFNICVFCGASDDVHAQYFEAGRSLGQRLAENGIGLIYGAGSTGVMGAVADGCLDAGGHVEGVVPDGLFNEAVLHSGLNRLHRVESMHARKALMAERAGAFVALPGGIGTFEELLEVCTWSHLGLHHKLVALLNVDGYYNGLLSFLNHATRQGFVRESQFRRLQPYTSIDALMTAVGEARRG